MRPIVMAVAVWTTFLAAALMPSIVGAASPRLNLITPRGMQRGTEGVFTFLGSPFKDAEEILFYSPGITVTKLEPQDGTVAAHVKIAADCRLGEHVAHVRTKSGVSDYRTFYIGALPAHDEKEPNSTFDAPQAIPLNVTVQGVIDTEDVDYFVVDLKKGQRLSVEVEAMRLGQALFDPYVAILDAKRFELSAADDTPLVKQDAVAAIVAPEDGKYYVQLRESSYGGNGSCMYRLHVGNFPRPKAVYPAGGKLGDEVEVKFIGDPAGEITQKVKLPTEPVLNHGLFASQDGGVAPSENPFRLFEHGNVLEAEPNNEVAKATSATLPMALNGIIDAPGDVDFFKFAAKKGETYEVECYGRRIRSAIDPVMVVYNAQGQGITSNDDSRGPDSYFRFAVPADGEYVLSVGDHLNRGGSEYVYRVEFTPVKTSLVLGIPRVERYGQYRQQIYVPRGGRFGAVVSATRNNFGGELVLEPKELPQGVKIVAEPMAANLSTMPVVFEAAADAPIAGKIIDFAARHADPNQKISGGFENRADFVIAEPGQSLYSWCDVNRLPVVVVDELPFSIEIVEPKVPLVQNGSMQLKIIAKRKPGFDAPINVQVPFLPPGVGGASSVDIPKGANEVFFPLNANSGAEVKKWKIFALGTADVGGAAWSSSQLASLEVAAPFVQFAMERAAVEQGQQTDLVCKVTVAQPFEGEAKVTVLGLPPKVTTAELPLTKDKAELVFKLATDATSPAGNHKNIFCQVVVVANGEPILHNVGGTDLRIDQPLPKPAAPAAAPAQPMPVAQATPAAAPEKRLTRLEKLRLEAKQREQAATAAAAGK
ncbi:MAG: PPC domain-containing protein [Planctomycetaceae bacterium]